MENKQITRVMPEPQDGADWLHKGTTPGRETVAAPFTFTRQVEPSDVPQNQPGTASQPANDPAPVAPPSDSSSGDTEQS